MQLFLHACYTAYKYQVFEYARYSDRISSSAHAEQKVEGKCESREEDFDQYYKSAHAEQKDFDQYYKNRGEMHWTENIDVARSDTVERTSNRMPFYKPESYQKEHFRQVKGVVRKGDKSRT